MFFGFILSLSSRAEQIHRLPTTDRVPTATDRNRPRRRMAGGGKIFYRQKIRSVGGNISDKVENRHYRTNFYRLFKTTSF
jgi:hypothetical protein